jgi:NADH-quinone oxidoreductase subunit M
MIGSVGLPGSSGFIGEFLSIVGVYKANPLIGILCALGVILGAVYMLKLYRCVMLGVPSNQEITGFDDLYLHEKLALAPLVILIVYIGIKPNEVLNVIEPTLQKLLYLY